MKRLTFVLAFTLIAITAFAQDTSGFTKGIYRGAVAGGGSYLDTFSCDPGFPTACSGGITEVGQVMASIYDPATKTAWMVKIYRPLDPILDYDRGQPVWLRVEHKGKRTDISLMHFTDARHFQIWTYKNAEIDPTEVEPRSVPPGSYKEPISRESMVNQAH